MRINMQEWPDRRGGGTSCDEWPIEGWTED